MYSLFVDTAYKYLSIAILEGDKILASYSEECFKKQSEKLFIVLDDLFTNNNLDRTKVNEVYITSGPGSYTGVRIAMTLAKVLCQTKKIDLYTISTLKLYAGNNPKTMAIMDARASRAYVGVYDKGKCLLEDQVLEISEIDPKDYTVVLDGDLVGKENTVPDIINCFVECKNDFEKVDNINHLLPKYLKESDAYYRWK